jgi:RHS repeat-associated protein
LLSAELRLAAARCRVAIQSTGDAAGNIASDTRAGVLNAYTYNNANRLKTVTVAANLKATYTYDAAQHLAIRVLTNMTPSGTIHTVYDRDGNLLMESNGLATGITRDYVWLPETQIAPTMGSTAGVPRPIAVVDAVNTATPVTWYVSTDHLNRPVRMTDAAKSTVWQATWKPFGEPQSITGSATLDARFPGQWFQLESGLAYNWNRSYDASSGRYTQPDPLEFVDGPSIYGYAKLNPIIRHDFRGLAAPDHLKKPPPVPDNFTCITAHVAKKVWCDWTPSNCSKSTGCGEIAKNIAAKRACMQAQQAVNVLCYGGDPDDPHGTRFPDNEQGIDTCYDKGTELGCWQCPPEH